MIETMRAKFRVDELNGNEEITEFTVKMSAVTDGSEENQDFNKYTPSGYYEMYVDNPKAKGFFKEGQEYYFDIKKA